MDLAQIKQLLGKEGGKIVIVENGKPTLIVISYEAYTKQDQQDVSYSEIPDEQEQVPTEELTIDDLPV